MEAANPSLSDAAAGNSLSSHMSPAHLDNHVTQDWPSVFSSHPDGMSLFHSTATSFADYLVLTRSYLCGTLRSGLNVVGPVARETEPILAQLEQLNSGGFLSVSSQPGLSTPQLQQRAYVEGFVERAWFETHINHKLATLDGGRLLFHATTIPSNTVLASNIAESGVSAAIPLEVTREHRAGEDDWTDCTHVFFDEALQEVEQFLLPRYHSPHHLVQFIAAARTWGGTGDLFSELAADVFDETYVFS
ncbi:hypothetical protein DFJ77DRAFT_452418 [Powellomyces hirtus]|nr:hypothetical protein DFJ77DRAFT_452418 [Powellomyces hirtus]